MKTLRTLMLAGALLAFAGSPSWAGSAAAKEDIGLGYDVYAGGFKALSAQLELDKTKSAYDVALHAQTEGFIGSLFPWEGNYSTTGKSDKGALIPEKHNAVSTWKDNIKKTEIKYADDGSIVEKTSLPDGKKQTDFKDELTRDTVDILTGTMKMLQMVENKNTCSGTVPVFDGKRRFNLTFREDGREMLEPNDYSSFKGEAIRCIITVEPVAGFREKDKKRGWMAVQEHTAQRNKLPTLWLARLTPTAPTVVPVRMEINSDYGTVVAHLTRTDVKK